MTGAIWNLLLGLAWVLLSGDFSGLNLLVGLIFGYITLVLIEPQLSCSRAALYRFYRLFSKRTHSSQLTCRVRYRDATLAYEAGGYRYAAFRPYRNGNYHGGQSDFINAGNA